MEQQKNLLPFIILIIVVAGIVAAFYYFTATTEVIAPPTQPPAVSLNPSTNDPLYPKKDTIYSNKKEPTIVTENLIIPPPEKVTVNSGRTVEVPKNKIETPLVPQTPGEKIIVPLATHSIKTSYELAKPEALQWSTNSKLSFIKSRGAITVDGKSSQWQLVFGASEKNNKGYEIIIQGDAIVSKREIDSNSVSADLPASWYDSDEALKQLASLPQFVNTLVSGINFFYNTDAKAWRYAIATDVGTTSLEL